MHRIAASRTVCYAVQSSKLALRFRRGVSRLSSPVSTLLSDAHHDQHDGNEHTVYGWVTRVRKQKQVTFAEIIDGSCSRTLQVVATPAKAASLHVGCSVRVHGILQSSPGSQQTVELAATDVHILGSCPTKDYPLHRFPHHSEQVGPLRAFPHLRCRTAPMTAMLRLRASMTSAMSRYFENEAIFRVECPIISFSDCEGGGEVFSLEASRPQHLSQNTQNASERSTSFFGLPAYATVSAQLHLEALMAGLSRVYTFGPAFRAERSQTSRHLAEFWMLEAEVAFVDQLDSVMDLLERLVRFIVAAVAGPQSSSACLDDLQLLRSSHSPHLSTSDTFDGKWPRITYLEAINLLRQSPHHSGRGELEWGSPLTAEDEKWLATAHFAGPVFVTKYPATLKPFYMRSAGNDEVECFDLLAPGIGEIAGGSLREERYQHLLKALYLKGMDVEEYKWYLDLRQFGSVPHGGFGMGWERLVSWITGISNVRECLAFPRAFSAGTAMHPSS